MREKENCVCGECANFDNGTCKYYLTPVAATQTWGVCAGFKTPSVPKKKANRRKKEVIAVTG
jgi:hypothetical protein